MGDKAKPLRMTPGGFAVLNAVDIACRAIAYQ
jgi:hypothetical protein